MINAHFFHIYITCMVGITNECFVDIDKLYLSSVSMPAD